MTPLKKRTELDIILQLLSKGFNKAEIRKKLNLKPSALSYHLRRLEDLGIIERKGKYVINVLFNTPPSSVYTPRVTKNQVQFKLNKRGHAFCFRVVFPKEENLILKPKVQHEFKTKNIKKLQFGSLKLIKDKNSIWINRKSLTIYSNNSYYSNNALHSKFRALKEVDNLIIYLKDRFGFSGIYGIEVFREHYGLIFNKFAKWLLKKGKKVYIKSKGNKTIFWVDNSRKDDIGLEEFEGGDPIKINTADNYFQSHENTDWKVTPEFSLKCFNEAGELIKGNARAIKNVFPVMNEYNKNLKLHTHVQQEQLKTQKETQKMLKKINKLITHTK